MPARFHPFVQDTNDLDDAGLDGAIVENVHGLSDGAGAAILTDMSQVEAANSGTEILPIPRCRASWIRGDLSHRGDQQTSVPPPGVITPSLGAHRENLFEIGLRRAGEPKSRHLVSGRAGTEAP
jgi:hypothetical protein